MQSINEKLVLEFKLKPFQVENAIKLIDEGNTIPFIARYRKEQTGEMSDEQLRDMFERLTYLRNLEKRKEEVIRLIDEQGKLTEELQVEIEKSETMTEVEDLYRPYKQKKRTRATIAKEKGLEPLALIIFEQTETKSIEEIATDFFRDTQWNTGLQIGINVKKAFNFFLRTGVGSYGDKIAPFISFDVGTLRL